MAQCARCGGESNELRTLRSRSNGPGRHREHVCAACLTQAHKNTGPTAEQMAESDERWDRVFQRFIDPDYYRAAVPALQSSFGAFAAQMETLCR